MVDALEILKNNQILYHQNVLDIKECIRQRYPHYTQKHTAELLASAIHKIIDKNIAYFDKEIQTSIKETLFQSATQKEVFAINAYDVLEACTSLEVSDEQYLDNLTDWINQNQDIPFSKQEVSELIFRLKDTEEISASLVSGDFEEQVALPPIKDELPNFLNGIKHRRLLIIAASALFSLLFIFSSAFKYSNLNKETAFTHLMMIRPKRDNVLQKAESLHLHPSLQYKKINQEALYNWLVKKNSTLAGEPYFSSIIGAAEEYNINPLLLFAITGQEQSFVPKSNPKASAIANNPFNVYGSWQVFNTDITNTSRIAARTIITLSEGCPKNEDPIKWINKKYAEDSKWHLGVTEILSQLEETAGN